MTKTFHAVVIGILFILPLVSQGKTERPMTTPAGYKCPSRKANATSELQSSMNNVSAYLKKSNPEISGYESCQGKQKGIASVYGIRGRDDFAGKRTASGEIMSPQKYRAAILRSASRQYPLGSWVRVTSGERSVVVCINDKGGGKQGRVIDLSAAASEVLGGDDLTRVEVECLVRPSDGQSRCDDKVATQITGNDF